MVGDIGGNNELKSDTLSTETIKVSLRLKRKLDGACPKNLSYSAYLENVLDHYLDCEKI